MCQTHSGYKPLKFPRYRSGRTCRGQRWRFTTLVHDHPGLHSNGCRYKTFSFKASQRLWGCPTQHHPASPPRPEGHRCVSAAGKPVRFVPCWCHSPWWQSPPGDTLERMTSRPFCWPQKFAKAAAGAQTLLLCVSMHASRVLPTAARGMLGVVVHLDQERVNDTKSEFCFFF